MILVLALLLAAEPAGIARVDPPAPARTPDLRVDWDAPSRALAPPPALPAYRDGWSEARRWTWYDLTLQAAFVGVVAVDWMQTSDFRAHGAEESNPLLGSHPSQAKVNLLFIGALAGHTLVAHLAPRPFRTIWQVIFIPPELVAIHSNRALGTGLRIPF
jgi:hypothetical protein